MNLLDEDELFGEGYKPVVQPRLPKKKKEAAAPVKKQRLQTPMQNYGAPVGWRGNTLKEHVTGERVTYSYDLHGTIVERRSVCRCIECMKRDYYCVEGPAWSAHESWNAEKLTEKGFVRMYDPLEKEITVGCAICHKPITLDGKTEGKFNDQEEVVLHVTCLPKAVRDKLKKLSYKLPYLIRAKNGPTDQGEDSGGDSDGGA
jgi:hypothetical protein